MISRISRRAGIMVKSGKLFSIESSALENCHSKLMED
jgi:hypothetical protein